jgi:hemoglobin
VAVGAFRQFDRDRDLRVPTAHRADDGMVNLEQPPRLAREFICAGAGGPQTNTGKDTLSAHKGMNISEQEYLAVTDDIANAMEKQKCDEETKGDVIAILYSLKGDIIRV